MKRAFLFPCLLIVNLPFALLNSSKADVLIDSFATPQSAPGGLGTRNIADGGGILGGERDIISYLTLSANGTVPGQLQIAFPNGLLTGRAGGDITYDGPDHDPSSSYYGGLGSVDLTQGGVNNCFQFDIISIANTFVALSIQVFSANQGSSVQVNLPHIPGIFDVPFSSFLFDGSPFASPVDFQNVGYIDFHFEMGSGDAVVMDSIIATTVPEPSTLALIACSTVGFLKLRRKR